MARLSSCRNGRSVSSISLSIHGPGVCLYSHHGRQGSQLVAEYSTLAAVDLGSNSFHCQIARVVGDQIYPLDGLREPVRLGAGLDDDKLLDAPSQERALACLQRFGERLRGFDRHAVRAVGT